VKVSKVVAAILKQNALTREKARAENDETVAYKDSDQSNNESVSSSNAEDVDD